MERTFFQYSYSPPPFMVSFLRSYMDWKSLVVVAVIVIVGATTVFESYTERELLRKIARSRGLWRQHWIVSVVSWDINCVGLLTISIVSLLQRIGHWEWWKAIDIKKIQGYFEVSIANFKLIHAFYSRFVFGTVLSSMPELLSWLSVD